MEPPFPQKSPNVSSTFPISLFIFSSRLFPVLCLIAERAFENYVRHCVHKDLISLTDSGLGVLGFGIWEVLRENETGALQTVDAPFFSLSFGLFSRHAMDPPTPPLSLTFFGLCKEGEGAALGFGPSHTRMAKYPSFSNASKKPLPSRFKHDSLAQRLNPPKRGGGNSSDKHARTHKTAHQHAYIHSQTERQRQTHPLDRSQESCTQSRFAREVVSVSRRWT